MVSIREFHYPDDYLAVRKLWEDMERGVRVGRSDEPKEIEKKISRDPDLFLVAQDEGGIVGSVIGGYDGRRGLLYHLAVARSHRQIGIGSQLLAEIEARLRDKGCLKCYLMVTPDNPEAGRFYEKRGWHFMDYVLPYGKELR
ncbi:MAG: GNAT family N-acetyltransferase [Anaerolineales bacterium]|nr:GNAT family N-acetyltransferase [Anaerolineae bacterium]PWB77994.1 MAG: GNAT family N-acetyltransferase [Anaerolineales bacterium]